MVASGLSFITLAYLKQDKALGVCMVSNLVAGLVDGLVGLESLPAVEESTDSPRRKRQEQDVKTARQAAYAHFVFSGVAAGVGMWLLMWS